MLSFLLCVVAMILPLPLDQRRYCWGPLFLTGLEGCREKSIITKSKVRFQTNTWKNIMVEVLLHKSSGKTKKLYIFLYCRISLCVLLEFKWSVAEGSSFKCLQTGIWIDWIILQFLEQNRQTDIQKDRITFVVDEKLHILMWPINLLLFTL